jgi:hypothetical protein
MLAVRVDQWLARRAAGISAALTIEICTLRDACGRRGPGGHLDRVAGAACLLQ